MQLYEMEKEQLVDYAVRLEEECRDLREVISAIRYQVGVTKLPPNVRALRVRK